MLQQRCLDLYSVIHKQECPFYWSCFRCNFQDSHVRTVRMLLPYVIKYNVKETTELYAKIAKSIGIHTNTNEKYVEILIQAVKDLMKKVDMPLSIKDMGLDWKTFVSELNELIKRAMVSSESITNPRVPDEEEFRRLFTYAFNCTEVDF
ncbi:MAG: iron-containing alcohol dehydrogenase [Nitrososphaeria archaeon]